MDEQAGQHASDDPRAKPAGEAVVLTEPEGGSTARPSPPIPSRLENQPTVISKQSPASLTPTSHLQPAEMGRVLQGETLGHYELLEFVGGGGMGAVFRALDKMLNRTVAVKVLSHEQSHDEETLRRFKNEAQSAARLDHENIGRVHYVGEDGGWHYIVFEFIEGINLRDLVERDGPLPIADAVSFMLQLGDALAHAARRDVVHRDIKPSNVLITPEGKAKLVDMGLARLHQVEHANNDLTASGVTLGTFDYISPEQARDPRSADVRSDLYSLGCTFYFMLTGRPPFPEGTVLQKLLQHQGEEPPDPRQFCPNLPDDVHRILKRLLAKSPDERYQEPGELVAELTSAAVRLGLRPASPGSMVWLATATQAGAQWQRALPWLAPVAALVLIVAVLNVIWTPNEATAPPLLGRLPRPENPRQTNAAVVPQASSDNGAGKRGTEGSATQKAASPEDAVRERATNDGGTSPPPDATNTMPWLESLVSRVFAAWDTLRSNEFGTRLTAAHQKLRSPFDMQPAVKNDGEARAENPASPAAATHAALVVAGKAATVGQYASLAAAVREAKNGDIIELGYDGVLEEEPLDISNLKLTIRAGRERAPVIQFAVDIHDVLAERRSMINLDGGELTLHGVRLTFTLPRDMTDDWSLFELGHADALRFQDCSVTVRNPSKGFDRPTATIVHVRAGLADGAGMMQDAMPVAPAVEVAARQSVFRGEATFLRFAKARPVELRLENVLVALSERLVEGDVGLMSTRNVSDSHLELRGATVLAESGLLRLTSDSGMSPSPGSPGSPSMRVEVECFDSILAGGPGSAMIEQVGSEPSARLRGQLAWSGYRSFYDGFATLWRVVGSESTQEHDFGEWREYWGIKGNQTKASATLANFAEFGDRPLHEARPADFRLLPGSPAIDAASKGGDAGAVLNDLPSPDPPQFPPQRGTP